MFDTRLAQTFKFRFVPGCPSKAVTSEEIPKEEESLARIHVGYTNIKAGDVTGYSLILLPRCKEKICFRIEV